MNTNQTPSSTQPAAPCAPFAPIAITGMGGVFPGAANLSEFWNLILEARSAAREAPPGRWTLDLHTAYASQPAQPDRVHSRRACFVRDEDYAAILPGLRALSTEGMALELDFELLAQLDPIFHLILHAGVQAYRSSTGKMPARDRIGVVLGNIALPTEKTSALARELLLDEKPAQPTHPLNRYATGLPAGLLAKALGLGAGSLSLDAACASSLYALKLAVDELHAGRADAMLAGGASRADALYTQMGFSQLRAVSPDGRCAPFDARGNGLVVGEGACVFVLKRLEDAEAAGDVIHGVLRGIGLSNDLEGNLLAPASEGQLRAMRPAYAQAGWNPRSIELIECHATGTPVGDAVEFESLSQLWSGEEQEPQQSSARRCVLGSVKSNVGHLLTGAGAAGLAKVLLALKANQLPPCAHFEQAGAKIALEQSAFEVLAQPKPWPKAEAPRRAAVSAFGFGGINAHVLIEEYQAQRERKKSEAVPKPVPAPKVAIVGLSAHFGPWRGLRAFQERVLGGGRNETPRERRVNEQFTARGWFVDEIRLPFGRFRIPPSEMREMLPQQALMLLATHEALCDAKLDKKALGPRAGIFSGINLDLNTTNFQLRWSLPESARAERERFGPPLNADRTMGALGGIVASRLAREFRCGGPCFTLGSEETSGLRALEVAVRALQKGELDLALTGAVDLSGDPRALLAWQADHPHALAGEGAAAAVLKRLDDAVRDGDRIYAVIAGLGTSTRNTEAALRQAYQEAQANPQNTGYWEVSAGRAQDSAREQAGLKNFLSAQKTDLAARLGCVRASIGDAGCATSFAGLVKAALCLYQEIIPAWPGVDARKESWPLSNALESQYWIRNRAAGPRYAGVSGLSVDGNCVQVLLEEAPESKAHETQLTTERLQPLGTRAEALFALEADDDAGLLELIQALRTLAEVNPRLSVEALAREWFSRSSSVPDKKFSFAILAASAAELLEHLAFCAQGLKDGTLRNSPSHDSGFPQALLGRPIWFCAKPAEFGGRKGLAFIYPGSGSHFLGMGRALATQWPEVLRKQDREQQFLRGQLATDSFWNAPAGMEPSGKEAIFGQVALGTVYSDFARALGLQPAFAVGYSLGESASLFGLRAWTGNNKEGHSQRDEMYRRVEASSLFTTDLDGPCNAARLAWNLPEGVATGWSIGLVQRPADEVRTVLEKWRAESPPDPLSQRAYLLIVNTPKECVIGGAPEAVARFEQKLGVSARPFSGVTIAHCEIVECVAKPYRNLHLFETVAPAGVRYYSGRRGASYVVNRESAADAVLAQASGLIDYPRVVEAAYRDGARIFLEIAPGASCSRMIPQILTPRPHWAKSLCAPGTEPVSALLRVIGQLIALRAGVDLRFLYGRPNHVEAHQPPPIEPPGVVLPALNPIFSFKPKARGESTVALPKISRPAPARPPSVRQPEPALAALAEPVMRQNANPATPPSSMPPMPARPATLLETFSAEYELGRRWAAAEAAKFSAHEEYLQFSENAARQMSATIAQQMALLEALHGHEGNLNSVGLADSGPALRSYLDEPAFTVPTEPPKVLKRAQCLEFGRGSIAKSLGPRFAKADSFPTRVRLPDEPLMLVDRILSIEAEPLAMTHGRVITEHDIHPGAWYLDLGRIPTCIAVESGQADLFLSGYLGIDFQTRGLACYRLLDAVVTFHRGLPGPGETIHYDIYIDRFFRQGETWLFRFRFEATVNGQPLLSMKNGCAGFFSAAELASGKGIVHTELDRRSQPGKTPADWKIFPPFEQVEQYSAMQIDALRRGELAACFGPAFANLGLQNPLRIPGGPGLRMTLLHRVTRLEPRGGRFGLGQITAEADIHPDDWFLTCHFVDDMVMPGTLMYECCLHTLRVFLLRMGWVAEQDGLAVEPLPGISSQLKCRGQVLGTTKIAAYQITLKEVGYGPEPYVLADALMFADGKPIVEIINMSARIAGLSREKIAEVWRRAQTWQTPLTLAPEKKRALYDFASIYAFATGKPSEAFGAKYKIFDSERKIARLPGPPYQFLDRITKIEQCEAWKLAPGGEIEGEYDVPPDAWYFASERAPHMPFAVLLEIALQPCGWLAAYLGSALTSPTDLSFRNLGGKAVQYLPVGPAIGTLTIKVKITKVSSSGGMIIQNFDFAVYAQHNGAEALLYKGDTYFGFFSKQALAQQVGIREAKLYVPSTEEKARAKHFAYPQETPFPTAQVGTEPGMKMLDRVSCYLPDGGPHGLGYIEGELDVNPAAWFFKAHFYQDPVCPGSLGLESFLQLLKVYAYERWGAGRTDVRFEVIALNQKHEWVYRGQVIPKDVCVRVQAVISAVDDAQRVVHANGYLSVDGRNIYEMKDFCLRLI